MLRGSRRKNWIEQRCCGVIELDQNEANETPGIEVQTYSAMALKHSLDMANSKSSMCARLHLRSAVLAPGDGKSAGSAPIVPDPPFDLDAAGGRTQRAVFVRVSGKLVEDEVQGECHFWFQLKVGAAGKDESAAWGVGACRLLDQLSKSKTAAV